MSIDYKRLNLYRSLKNLSSLLIREKFGVEYKKHFDILIIKVYYLETLPNTFKKIQHHKKIKINHDTFLNMNVTKQYNFIKNKL